MGKCAVKIMSWNIRHGRGMEGRVELRAIIEEIKVVNPDVVALQEVDRFRKRSGGDDQIRLLAESLGMFWCFAASICDGFSEYGNAIASKHPIADSRVLVMPGRRERRTLLEAEIMVGAGHYAQQSGDAAAQGARLTVLTTHLGVNEDDRRMQAPLLLRRLASAPMSAVLSGDFNVGPEHALPLELQRAGWRRLCQTEPARPTYADRAEIDLMFMSGWGGELPELRVLDSSASDHCPIVADIPLGVIK